VTQNWLLSATIAVEKNPAFFTENDIDILKTLPKFPMFTKVKNYMFHTKT